MNYSPEHYPDIKSTTDKHEMEKVKRRFSEVSASLDLVSNSDHESSDLNLSELDLRQDYQHAVNCIVQCETIINTLHEQLASKDVHIASLEDRIVQMSLELASTKAREDQLEHKLRTSVTSAVIPCSRSASPEEPLDVVDSGKTSFTTAATTSFTSGSGGCNARTNNNIMGGNLDDSNKSSSRSMKQGGWNLDDSNSSRLSNFGQFIKNCTSIRSSGSKMNQQQQQGTEEVVQVMQVPLASEIKNEDVKPNKKKWLNEHNNFNDDDDIGYRQQRRPPNRKRMELQKSSRSFLEEGGVVFPVSSFDVLKGCIDRSMNKGSSGNEEWGTF